MLSDAQNNATDAPGSPPPSLGDPISPKTLVPDDSDAYSAFHVGDIIGVLTYVLVIGGVITIMVLLNDGTASAPFHMIIFIVIISAIHQGWIAARKMRFSHTRRVYDEEMGTYEDDADDDDVDEDDADEDDAYENEGVEEREGELQSRGRTPTRA